MIVAGTSVLREVRVSRMSVMSNIETLGLDRVDLTCDAYGHGALEVAEASTRAGVGVFVVRDERQRATIAAAGFVQELIVGGSPPDGSAYGIGERARLAGALPVMRVSARVVSLKMVATGEGVSYGHIWHAPAPTRLALVPLGYADGLSRSASNVGSLWLADALRPIVGRVAMNVCVVDVGDTAVEVGDEAVLFGGVHGHTADAWAAGVGVDALETTSAFGGHISREFM